MNGLLQVDVEDDDAEERKRIEDEGKRRTGQGVGEKLMKVIEIL
jgi:hypothetical protein